MPYITPKDRKDVKANLNNYKNSLTKAPLEEVLNQIIHDTAEKEPYNPGLVNYLMTSVCLHYIKENGQRYTNIDYVINQLKYIQYNLCKDYYRHPSIGTIECVILEFYRIVAAPYEDVKRFENGEVK